MQAWRVYVRDHPQYGRWYQRVEGRPGWVWKSAITAAVLIIIIPLVLLSLAAILVGVLVFLVLGLIASILRLFQPGNRSGQPPMSPRSADDGRENVRIMDP